MRLAQLGYLQSHGHPLPTYKGPPWPGPEPEKAESACDLIAFYRDYPFASCSPKVAHLLAALHADYAMRPPDDA